MSANVEVILRFASGGDADTRSAIRALKQMDGIIEVKPVFLQNSDGRSSGIIDFSSIAIAVAPELIRGVTRALASLFSRPGAPPVNFNIKLSKAELNLNFDPRSATFEEITLLSQNIIAEFNKDQQSNIAG